MIRGHGVQIGFRGKVLSPIPFDFHMEGKLCCLIGPNGSGKTSLIAACMGERLLLSGRIELDGKDVRKVKPRELSKICAYVPQEHPFLSDLRLRDFLQTAFLSKVPYFGSFPKGSSDEIQRVLVSLGLASHQDRSMNRLSSGERQRAFLGHALIRRPRLLMLDEPTNHLDPGGIEAFWKSYWELGKEMGSTALVSTHDLEFCRKHADWMIAIKNGVVIYTGKPQSFFDEQKHATLYH